MALPTLVVGNELQTQVNTLTQALRAGKEANHVKLTDYYSTDKEDIYEQCENVTRMVDVNRWQARQIHVLVGAHLKEAVTDFYEENRETFTQQTGGTQDSNLKEGLIERFASVATKDTWYADYLNCN